MLGINGEIRLITACHNTSGYRQWTMHLGLRGTREATLRAIRVLE